MQYETVLKTKLSLVQTLSDRDPAMKLALSTYKSEYLEKNKEKIKKQKLERVNENKKLEYTHSWVYIAYAIVAFFLVFTFTNQKWDTIHTLSMFMVIFAYITEIYFFFLVVQKYEFVGDHMLYSTIYKKITKGDTLSFDISKISK